ncbi:MAG: hypothetical protein UT58_C0002G0039 [Microgenomates group bacterium GW2011_GWC1_39_7b]|uniref:Aspartyl protease n=2 Tax=Candidatus Woeseibacteriota TaxID=1752722 RepID=A0A0G0P1P6_9BACT|nr:MAG: hypothetical protein UT17_C0003G0062 [Candidatus Woesebacteria bacterium GW2011_GWB1_39_10]KKR27006.1 MAG: hypothetical protein UT58_C0002G0039 [Microgenomates group bacterium GW2011_GWC1_39_7b]KKS90999.1 MAG: hypothetical protein UV66_C0001G0356 [Candidatus Woesebacteria bacterium GW2011_GWA1_43_12]
MGLTTIPLIITDLSGKKRVEGDFLVDTGASFTVIPLSMAKKLGLKSDRKQKFSLADGSIMERDLSFAIVLVNGQKAPSTVVIGKSTDSPLLGALTLKNMGLMVNPFSRELIPMKLMLG